MSLQNTPAAERIHIGFFGRRNAGKSSLVNAITGQSLSVVSDIKGTTTEGLGFTGRGEGIASLATVTIRR